MPSIQSRRRFLTKVALAGTMGLGGAAAVALGGGRKSLAAEPPPTTSGSTCGASSIRRIPCCSTPSECTSSA
jgi:hypothetical protein